MALRFQITYVNPFEAIHQYFGIIFNLIFLPTIVKLTEQFRQL